jgi:hypothetical protein
MRSISRSVSRSIRSASESPDGGGGGFVRLGRGQGRDHGEHLLGGRVDHLERLAFTENPAAVNVRAGGVSGGRAGT